LQIYCDFSGYSDIALGTAHLLGYRLAQNFNMPYLSRNIAEFWRRWHISLSSWLRDYLFIPLGGSRGTLWLTCRNLLITMALGGLWHGANWTFVIWGLLHGVLLILHRLFRLVADQRPLVSRILQSPVATPFCVLTTFLCVCLGWVFFRAQSFPEALLVLKHLVIRGGLESLAMPKSAFWLVLGLVIVGHLLGRLEAWRWLPTRVSAPVLGMAYSISFTLTLILAPPTGKTFIYFQF
jgi:alginate O-acetyltransferase complex protein AlgI